MFGSKKREIVVCTTLLLAMLTSACGQPQKQKLSATNSPPASFYDGLTEIDREAAVAARQQALESRVSQQSLEWRSAQSNIVGKVRPIRTFKIAGGQYCREFEERLSGVSKFGRVRQAIACRRDGQWVVVEKS